MAWSSEQPPRFYFSLRSPYSWLALHDLGTVYPDVAAAVQWRPFWEPDPVLAAELAGHGAEFPYSAMSRAKHLYILQDVKRLATARGLRPAWPIDREPVWEVPHLAYLLADQCGRGREFVVSATKARWEAGRDICDPAVVAELAAGVGVDPALAQGAASEPELRAEGLARLLDVCTDGVFGVPYFVSGRARFWGIDRLAAFAEHVWARLPDPASPEPSLITKADADDGHAGGCG